MWHFVSACHSACSPSVIKLWSLKSTLICVAVQGATVGDGNADLQFSGGATFCLFCFISFCFVFEVRFWFCL